MPYAVYMGKTAKRIMVHEMVGDDQSTNGIRSGE